MNSVPIDLDINRLCTWIEYSAVHQDMQAK